MNADFSIKIASLKKRGRFVKPGFDVPKRISSERLAELVPRLKSGDKTVIEEIIHGHLAYCTKIVTQYASRFTHLTDDLLDEAYLALTQAVNWCLPPESRLQDDNITPYIAVVVHSFVQSFIERSPIVYKSGRTIRHHYKIGKVKVAYFSTTELSEDVASVEYDHSDIDVKEILDKVTYDFIEKKIIELRAEGYSYEEIGPKVGLGRTRVGILVNTVAERYEKYA